MTVSVRAPHAQPAVCVQSPARVRSPLWREEHLQSRRCRIRTDSLGIALVICRLLPLTYPQMAVPLFRYSVQLFLGFIPSATEYNYQAVSRVTDRPGHPVNSRTWLSKPQKRPLALQTVRRTRVGDQGADLVAERPRAGLVCRRGHGGVAMSREDVKQSSEIEVPAIGMVQNEPRSVVWLNP